MNNKIFLSFVPVALMFLSFGAGMLLLKLYNLNKRSRRNPLTRNLLRSPGQSLHREIDNLSEEINSYLTFIFFFPVLLYGMYVPLMILNETEKYRIHPFVFILVCAGFVGYFFYRFLRLTQKRDSYRLGFECEMAVGQELNNLMLQGYRVYHDFPAENFNIDHVVVGPKGVFAIETKGYAKPDKKGRVEEAKVTFDGQALKFPNWSESKSIEQAKRQAAWLSKWLNSAVGESIAVQPALVLPGWFVVREKPADLLIFNGKNPEYLLKYSNISLSETLIKRIVHQLEQKCRDIEPIAYSK